MLPIDELRKYVQALQDMSSMMDQSLLQMAVANIPGEGRPLADVTHGMLLTKLQGANACIHAATTTMLADLRHVELAMARRQRCTCQWPQDTGRPAPYRSKVRKGTVLVDGWCCSTCDLPTDPPAAGGE